MSRSVVDSLPALRQYFQQHVTYHLGIDVETFYNAESRADPFELAITDFIKEGGSKRLLWYTVREKQLLTAMQQEQRLENEDTLSNAQSSMSTASAGGASVMSKIDDADSQDTHSTTSSAAAQQRVIVSTDQLHTLEQYNCVYFLRDTDNDPSPITEKDIHYRVFCGRFLEQEPGLVTNQSLNLIGSLTSIMGRFMLPMLRLKDDFGDLTALRPNVPASKVEEVVNFVGKTERFRESLNSVSESLKATLTLSKPTRRFCIEFNLKSFSKAGMKREVVECYEATVYNWIRQIEKVLSVGFEDPVAPDAGGGTGEYASFDDDDGPDVELEFWKKRTTLLNHITDGLQSRPNRTILGVLTAAGPRAQQVMTEWKAVELALTEAANEAKDNMKYLGTLEQFAEPLFADEPKMASIKLCIPAIINMIKMVHTISKYYNTCERLTGLFVKTTNQIIKACRKYLERNGSVWEQSPDIAIEDLRACVELKDIYLFHYRQTKGEMAANTPGPQFNFSEASIFGKFDLFAARVSKLIDVMHVTRQFDRLMMANIEHIHPLCHTYQTILSELRSQAGDYLEARRRDFDATYQDYKFRVQELSTELVVFLNNRFLTVTNTSKALHLLSRFRVVLNNTHITRLLEEKHSSIFMSYGRDLEAIKAVYEKHKENPPCHRNTPPVSGAISWVRQLQRKIEGPMTIFQETPQLFNHSRDAKRIIRTYNKVAKTFVTYETRWYEAWANRVVEDAKEGLQATLLVCDKATGRVHVNFDLSIRQLCREVYCLIRLGFPIPHEARSIHSQKNALLYYSEELHYMLDRYYKLIDRIDKLHCGLIIPHINRLNVIINPGLVQLTWTSLNISLFIKSVDEALSQVETIVDRVNGILKHRVEACNEAIRKISFICVAEDLSLPNLTHSPKTITEMIALQKKHTKYVSNRINVLNCEVASATREVVSITTHGYTSAEMQSVMGAITELYTTFEHDVFTAILYAMQQSVLYLKTRITGPTARGNLGSSVFLHPAPAMFHAEVVIKSRSVDFSPSLEDLQRCVNQMARSILETARGIYRWKQDGKAPHTYDVVEYQSITLRAERQARAAKDAMVEIENDSGSGSECEFPKTKLKSLFLRIGKNRKMTKVFLQLTGAVSSLQGQLSAFLQQFSYYDTLLKGNRANALENFNTNSHSFEAYEENIQLYDNLEKDVQLMPTSHSIGCLVIDLTKIKTFLANEAAAWKAGFGVSLNSRVKAEMDTLIHSMEVIQAKLNRKVHDLSDVNSIMKVITQLRFDESEIDMKLQPIVGAYDVLYKYNVRVTKEEQDQVDRIGFQWNDLVAQSRTIMDQLQQVGPRFKMVLLNDVVAFQQQVHTFKQDYDRNGPMTEHIEPRLAVERLKVFEKQFIECKRKLSEYAMGEQLFGLPITRYPEVEQIERELNLLSKLYDLYTEVLAKKAVLEELPWIEVDINKIRTIVKAYHDRVKKMPSGQRDWQGYKELRLIIDELLDTIPILELLLQKWVFPRHWQQLSTVTGTQLNPKLPEFRLKHVLEARLINLKGEVEEITTAAQKEYEIEVKLGRIKEEWSQREVTLAPFKNRGYLVLKSDATSELVSRVEEAQTILTSLLSSRFNEPFKKDIMLWISKLTTTQERIGEWLEVQHLWIYMEAVFSGSGDIGKEMPHEVKRFGNIDRQWTKIMRSAAETPNALKLCVQSDMLSNLLPHLRLYLDMCKKSLSGYLSSKRAVQPRFFFVSNSQLLEILGQASNPQAVQVHLSSITNGVHELMFDEEKSVLGFQGRDVETVIFDTPVTTERDVVEWLQSLLDESASTLRMKAKRMLKDLAVFDNPTTAGLKGFCERNPAQLVLLALQILWTNDCEYAFTMQRTEKGSVSVKVRKHKLIQETLMAMVREGDLSQRERVLYELLILTEIHQFDFITAMQRQLKKVRSIGDFEWVKQTRYYWKTERDSARTTIIDVDFEYGFEYQGLGEKMVMTDLTDRMYISASQALGMGYGSLAHGPSGTGKTETMKDMGRSFGRYVVVMNCSDQMSVHYMASLFKGIATSGCWAVFDDIDRVPPVVLSVVASQVACVLHGKRNRQAEINFPDGTSVKLSPISSVLVTVSPASGARQEGRYELPASFKSMFRSVAMIIPDRQAIARVRLAAGGFLDSANLARKFQALYAVSEDHLGRSGDYDFGLRSVNAVLRRAGELLKRQPLKTHPSGKVTAEDVHLEKSALITALRNMNLAKFTDSDASLFSDLLSDIFPGHETINAVDADVKAAVPVEVANMDLTPAPEWLAKIYQIYEQILARTGVCLLGPSASGKSSALTTLEAVINSLNEAPMRVNRLNPKTLSTTELYGRHDINTGDWSDGIFTALWRRVMKRNFRAWIWLDGPLDSVWAESLNTVLDDTKALTLPNNERLPLSQNLTLIFEVDSLQHASPSTVSRLGLVHFGAKSLQWPSLLTCWCTKHRQVLKTNAPGVVDLYHKYVPGLLAYVRRTCALVVELSDLLIVMNMLKLNEGLFDTTNRATGQTQALVFQRMSLFSIAWGVGGLLEDHDRARVNHYFVGQKADVPEGQSLFDIYVDQGTGAWIAWKLDPDRHYGYLPGVKPADLHRQYLPTVQSMKLHYLLKAATRQVPNHPNQMRNALVVGKSGVGKTCTVLNYLRNAAMEGPSHHRTVHLSSVATPASVQASIISFVDKISGSNWGPPPGTLLHIFIDDITMPAVDDFGGQPPLEVLRQLLDAGYFLNRSRLETAEKLMLACTHLVGAMDHPSVRRDVPARLKQHFFIINATLPSAESLDALFTAILNVHFTKELFPQPVTAALPALVAASRELWDALREKLVPTPQTEHYMFSLRDLSRVTHSLCRARPETITSFQDILQLWETETRRVYCDKLLPADEKWVSDRMRMVLDSCFGVEAKHMLQDGKQLWTYYSGAVKVVDEEVLLALGPYEKADVDALRPGLLRQMDMYNGTTSSKKVRGTVLMFAMQHLLRVTRVLRTPRGSMMLVGPVGSGKRSICRLASYVVRYTLFEMPAAATYTATSFMEDLRELQKSCAMGSPVSVLACEASIQDPAITDIIHVLVSGGDVVGLHQKDELELVFADLLPYLEGGDQSQEALQAFFAERVYDNLHILLCMSSVSGAALSQKLRSFPSLAKECVVDLFQPWPMAALTDVAHEALSDLPQGDREAGKGKRMAQLLGRHVAHMHTLMHNIAERYAREQRLTVLIAAGDFFEHLKILKEKFCTMLEELENKGVQLQNCLRTLIDAHDDLKSMRTSLGERQASLDKQSHTLHGMEDEIAQQSEYVDGQVQKVDGTRAELAEEAAAIQREKDEADKQLAAAAPALLAADEALQSIRQDDLTTLRRLTTAPPIVRRIFDAMLLVMHAPIESPAGWENDASGNRVLRASWTHGRGLAMDPKLLAGLQEFPRHTINDEDCELLAPYLGMEEFNVERAKATAGSIAGLCTWVRMMTTYHQFSKATAPRRARLAIAEAHLYKARLALTRAEQELAVRQAELAECRAKYQKAFDERTALQNDVEATRRRVATAETLLVGLDGEGEQWRSKLNSTIDAIRTLAGNAARISVLLTYCPPFNQRYRGIILQECESDLIDLGIPFSQGDIEPLLMDENAQRSRVLEGLPLEPHAMQNACVVEHARKRVLLLDPQGQGVRWILTTHEEKGIYVVNIKSSDFQKVLKAGMREGKTVIIDGVNETLPGYLQPLLDGNYMKATLLDGSRVQLCLVDGVETEVSEGFNAIFVCPLMRPRLHHELFTKLCVVDFAMTKTGMAEQLLRVTVRHEKPSLEEDRLSLLDDILSYEKVLKECNERLLSRLSIDEDSRLLADGATIEALQLTKEKSNEFEDRLKECKEATEKIKQAREDYRPIALRGATLYQTVAQMVHVQHVYHVSLDQFMQQFRAALQRAPANPYPPKRVANVVAYATNHIFHFMRRGFYAQDKHVFALLLALEIQQESGQVAPAEIDLLRHHPQQHNPKADPSRPAWVRPEEWALIGLLDRECKGLAALRTSIKTNGPAWMEWHGYAKPEETVIPHIEDRITPFQRLLIINALRQDRMAVATTNFIHSVLGTDCLRSDAMNYSFFDTVTPRNPVLCLLSPGVDPNSMIDALSRKHRVTVAQVSMGEQQEDIVMRVVQQALQEGSWVVLHNCHLCTSFVATLADYLRSTKHEPAPSSVIWMTSLPCADFPIAALNRSIKISLEAPTGMKAGLSHAFNSITQDQLDSIHQREWRMLLYTLCFLHTAVVERNRYGTTGWSHPYDFTPHDLQVSASFLYNYLYSDIKKGVAWPTVQYMLCGVLYGGRISDPHDQRILNAYGERWLLDEVFDTHGGGFSFAPGYRVADYLTTKEYQDHIAHLPQDDRPETIGLHESAARVLNDTASLKIIDSVSMIARASAPASHAGAHAAVLKICKDVPAMLAHILAGTVDEGLRLQGSSPLALLLAREVDAMRTLARYVMKSCELVKGVCHGTTVLTDELDAVLNSLSVRGVPAAWVKMSWRARSLDTWLQHAALRMEQLELWLTKGPPRVFHLPGFFYPSALLTTLKQEFLRPHLPTWSLDMVEMKAELTRHSSPEAVVATSSMAEEGCYYIHGLWLVSAAWDRTSNMIADPPNNDCHHPLPAAKLQCTVSQSIDTKHFLCPVFRDVTRAHSKFIFNLTIKTDQTLDTWVLRGAVAVCTTE